MNKINGIFDFFTFLVDYKKEIIGNFRNDYSIIRYYNQNKIFFYYHKIEISQIETEALELIVCINFEKIGNYLVFDLFIIISE